MAAVTAFYGGSTRHFILAPTVGCEYFDLTGQKLNPQKVKSILCVML